MFVFLILIFTLYPNCFESFTSLKYALYSSELNYTQTSITYPSEWVCTNDSQRIQACNGDVILGRFGMGDSVTRKFTNLAPHNKIKFSFRLYLIDSWDNEVFQLYADGVLVYSFLYSIWEKVGTFSCGPWYQVGNPDFFPDRVVDVDYEFSHSKSDLTLELTSNLDEDNESWGISKFNLYLSSCADECLDCSVNNATDSCNQCLSRTAIKTASANNYETCMKCHDSCKTCFGDGSSQCTSCFDNAILDTPSNYCQCNSGYYLKSLSPYLCYQGEIDPTSECSQKLNSFLNLAQIVHWCDANTTNYISKTSIQISPHLISTECLTTSLAIINLSGSSSIATFTITIQDSLSLIEYSLAFTDMKKMGCEESLIDDFDTFNCFFRLSFLYKDSIQATYEFHTIANLNRNINQQFSVASINRNVIGANCLKDSCNTTYTPSSSIMVCDSINCTQKRNSVIFTRGDYIDMIHTLDDTQLQSFYYLEKVKVVMTTSTGQFIDKSSSCKVTQKNTNLIYTCLLELADEGGAKFQISSKLIPVYERRLLEGNIFSKLTPLLGRTLVEGNSSNITNNYTDFVIQTESLTFVITNGTDISNDTSNSTANAIANNTANNTANDTANGTTNGTTYGTANGTVNGTANGVQKLTMIYGILMVFFIAFF